MGGEGPLTFHLFSSSECPTVGIFIERFFDNANRIPPATSLYILQCKRGVWSDVTRDVLPMPFDPRLYYEFSPSADTLTVREYTHSPKGYIMEGRTLKVWHWTGKGFSSANEHQSPAPGMGNGK